MEISMNSTLAEITDLLKEMRGRVESDLEYHESLPREETSGYDDWFKKARKQHQQFASDRGRIAELLIPLLDELIKAQAIVIFGGSIDDVTQWNQMEVEKSFSKNTSEIEFSPGIVELRMHDDHPILILDLETVGQAKGLGKHKNWLKDLDRGPVRPRLT
jgi:hypothetical protein